MLLDSLISHASIAKITAQLLSLSKKKAYGQLIAFDKANVKNIMILSFGDVINAAKTVAFNTSTQICRTSRLHKEIKYTDTKKSMLCHSVW